MMEKIGVVAFRIDARPLGIMVCAQNRRLKGSRLLSKPIMKNAAIAPFAKGHDSRRKPRTVTAR